MERDSSYMDTSTSTSGVLGRQWKNDFITDVGVGRPQLPSHSSLTLPLPKRQQPRPDVFTAYNETLIQPPNRHHKWSTDLRPLRWLFKCSFTQFTDFTHLFVGGLESDHVNSDTADCLFSTFHLCQGKASSLIYFFTVHLSARFWRLIAVQSCGNLAPMNDSISNDTHHGELNDILKSLWVLGNASRVRYNGQNGFLHGPISMLILLSEPVPAFDGWPSSSGPLSSVYIITHIFGVTMPSSISWSSTYQTRVTLLTHFPLRTVDPLKLGQHIHRQLRSQSVFPTWSFR